MLEIVRGALEGLSRDEEGSSSGAGTSDASGDNRGDQGGDGDNRGTGVSLEGSMRVGSPMPREGGLIMEMEAGAGGWFNGNPEDVPESWSGPNSDTSASQD